MHVVVTGAAGFVGAALVQRLRAHPQTLAAEGKLELTLVDHCAPQATSLQAERWHIGSFADLAFLQRLREHPPQCVFHLASVPGALAEREPALGLQANLLDTVALMEALARTVRAGQAHAPRLVFGSSVAVYGTVGLEPVLESRTPQPTLSYGAHKWVTELLLADYSRRGELDACSLRLPGIVARPPSETGHGSAFMSHIFHALLSAQTYTCPVSSDATAWWMSRQRCLDNLIHAARLPAAALPVSRCWQPPVLQASVAEVVQAIAQRLGRDPQAWIRYAPDSRIEALFGRQPPVLTPHAEAAGFTHDGSVHALVEHVFTELQSAAGGRQEYP